MEDHMNTARLAVTAAFARGVPNYRTTPAATRCRPPVTIYHASPHGLRDGLRRRIVPGAFVDTTHASTNESGRRSACHASQKDGSMRRRAWTAISPRWTTSAENSGAMSRAVQAAEGWRRHLHYGFGDEADDPLRDALREHYLLEPGLSDAAVDRGSMSRQPQRNRRRTGGTTRRSTADLIDEAARLDAARSRATIAAGLHGRDLRHARRVLSGRGARVRSTRGGRAPTTIRSASADRSDRPNSFRSSRGSSTRSTSTCGRVTSGEWMSGSMSRPAAKCRSAHPLSFERADRELLFQPHQTSAAHAGCAPAFPEGRYQRLSASPGTPACAAPSCRAGRET